MLTASLALTVGGTTPAGAEAEGASSGESKSSTASLPFEDHFTSKTLRPEWDLRNEDKNRWLLIDGEYLLLVSTAEASNILIYRRELPSSFEVEAHFRADLTSLGGGPRQCVTMELSQDIQNSVWTSFCGRDDDVGHVYFGKTQNGKVAEFQERLAKKPTEFGLRIVKRGPELVGYYSKNSGAWTKVGFQYFVGLDAMLTVRAWNTGSRVPEGGVYIDYIAIR